MDKENLETFLSDFVDKLNSFTAKELDVIVTNRPFGYEAFQDDEDIAVENK